MARELATWLFGERVGSLSLVGGRLSFSYASDWLSNPQAVALSASLPLQAEPFDDARARPFFSGLLPEGQMRRVLARLLQVSGQNDFALLDQLGGECAGAVSLLEPGRALPAPRPSDPVRWLSDAELVALIDELPTRPMLAGEDGLRLSLAGAQDKLPVVFEPPRLSSRLGSRMGSRTGSRIGLPLNGTPSSHILKPAIRAVEDSVHNEAFCMALARAMQLGAAHTSIHTVQDRAVLLVQRYDRAADATGSLQRIHQEDFCQALGVVPEMKYQNEGGPDLIACFELVRRASRPSAPQVLRLFDAVIFNALIGNHDAHAKNFSLLYPSTEPNQAPALAPLYDLLSTAIYPTLSPRMAMKLGGKYKFSEVQASHWELFAESAGLAKSLAKRRILQMAQALPAAARHLQSTESEFAGNSVVERIVSLIDERSTLTIRRLT